MVEQAGVEGRCGAVDWAVRATPYKGQRRSGDAFLVQKTTAGVFIAVVDAMGHGQEAADVAERALASLRETAEQPLISCFAACHEALRGSRGAAMTLMTLDPDLGCLVWVAVGNVEAAVVVRGDHGRGASRRSVPLRGGVVGDRLPPLRESTVPLVVGGMVVSATDGLAPAFLDGVDLSMGAQALARQLHRSYARADDDALVLVARCGAESIPAFDDH